MTYYCFYYRNFELLTKIESESDSVSATAIAFKAREVVNFSSFLNSAIA